MSEPVSSRLDSYAASLLQPEARDRVFALCVAGDLFCCRIVMAMAIDTALFLDGTNWCSSHDQVTPESVIEVALMTSVLPTASSPKLALEAEVMSVLQESTYTGLWEFFAASHVLKCPAQSVFSSSRVGDLQGTLQSHRTGSWVSDRAESVCNVVLELYRCCGRALGAKPLCAPHVARTVLWYTKEGKFPSD